MDLAFRKLNSDSILPTKHYPNDAGVDLYMPTDGCIQPGDTVCIPSGLAVHVPIGHEANIYPRSSVGAKGVISIMAPIDATFTGEFNIILANISRSPFTYKKGDRLCQLVLHSVAVVNPVDFSIIHTKYRTSNGLGSTGK